MNDWRFLGRIMPFIWDTKMNIWWYQPILVVFIKKNISQNFCTWLQNHPVYITALSTLSIALPVCFIAQPQLRIHSVGQAPLSVYSVALLPLSIYLIALSQLHVYSIAYFSINSISLHQLSVYSINLPQLSVCYVAFLNLLFILLFCLSSRKWVIQVTTLQEQKVLPIHVFFFGVLARLK